MPRYRIFYLKDSVARTFREAGPKPQPYLLRRHDYEQGSEIEASNPYEAWKRSQGQQAEGPEDRRMDVGDALESESSELLIMNFWGFDEARWEGAEEPARAGAPDSNGRQENAKAAEQGRTAERAASHRGPGSPLTI